MSTTPSQHVSVDDVMSVTCERILSCVHELKVRGGAGLGCGAGVSRDLLDAGSRDQTCETCDTGLKVLSSSDEEEVIARCTERAALLLCCLTHSLTLSSLRLFQKHEQVVGGLYSVYWTQV